MKKNKLKFYLIHLNKIKNFFYNFLHNNFDIFGKYFINEITNFCKKIEIQKL